jgi:outer membrane protein assembly factor BamB
LGESIKASCSTKIKLKEEKTQMKFAKNKTAAIAIAILLTLSMSASMMLIPNASAHTPTWNMPTYAYIFLAPSPIGVGQTIQVYIWLDMVFGAAGGTSAIVGTTGYTASAALTSNNYRFHNYQVVITAPDGTTETKTFSVIMDTTSNQVFSYTPTQVGTYTFNFTFPGQAYAQYDHYANSVLVNDTYLPSTASTTLTVQQEPIPAAVNSAPMPTAYWTRPIYGEATDWYTISSNWLGSGQPPIAGYTSSATYHGDAIGPLTAHVIWTKPIQQGGVVGGNEYTTAQGVGYFEGSCYCGRFTNPIIIDGYLYYAEVIGFTVTFGASAGNVDCVDLRTGQLIWSKSNIPPLSFGYIYNLWNGEQHGVFPPILVASIGGGLTGLPAMWELFDGFTGTALFNVTGVPTGTTIPGPSSEQLKLVFANAGTPTSPQWYLAEWNSSRIWQYDVNPYTSGGSLSPSVINATNGALLSVPIPIAGATGTLPPTTPGTAGATILVPYGSAITVNANIPINSTTVYPTNLGAQTTYDWNISLPWLNTMPLQATLSAATGLITMPPAGTNPVSVVSANYGDVMLCRNGSLPVGFATTSSGYPQLPYTLFAVNLNASRGAIGSILWMQNYNPTAGNLTVSIPFVDWQTRVFALYYEETEQFAGYSLTTGAKIWGPTAPMNAMQYYELGYGILGAMAYGNIYVDGMGGVCYCFNDLTGNLLWTYGNGGEGNSTYSFSSPYGEYPMYVGPIGGNGVVYLMANEHTVTDPIYKGAQVVALNATTGQEIWTLSCYGSMATPVLADGFATFLNGYDMQIYTVGRGPSATAVEAPKTSIELGRSLVISGTVMDIAAGTTQTAQAAVFPNGVPVASDASMTVWMEHVYQQKPLPTNFTGVPVTVDVLDSNGNYRNIGTATTDATGTFSLQWTPDIPGKYTVIATFAGTNGYWPSYSETSFAVDPAAATASPYPTVNLPPTEMCFAVSTISIIIAIAIVGLLILRKKP